MCRTPGFCRRVQNKWMHDYRVAGGGYAGSLQRFRHCATNFFVSESDVRVRAGDDTEAASLLVGIFNMQADRRHVIQHCTRGLDVVQAVLASPRSPLRDLRSTVKGYGTILVPGHEPVPLRR